MTFKVFAVWMVVAVGAFWPTGAFGPTGRDIDAARRAWAGVAEVSANGLTPNLTAQGLTRHFPLKSTWLNDYFSPC